MPAKAGIQNYLKTLDSRLRGNDAKRHYATFYEFIKDTGLKFSCLILSMRIYLLNSVRPEMRIFT